MRLPYGLLANEGLKALGGVYAYIVSRALEKPLVDSCWPAERRVGWTPRNQ